MRPTVCRALLLAALASTACKTMKTVTLDQMSVLGPERVWVTEHDQSVVLMYEPKVVRDTLTGYVGRHREKMPSDRVQEVRMQTKASTRTALLVVGLTGGFVAFVLVASGTGQSPPIVSTTGPPGLCDIAPEQPLCTGVPD